MTKIVLLVAIVVLLGGCSEPVYLEDSIDRSDGLTVFSPRPGIECIQKSMGHGLGIGCYEIPQGCSK